MEEGGILGPELSIGRNRPFPISGQQRLEYEGQVESTVRGRALKFNTEQLPAAHVAENVGGS